MTQRDDLDRLMTAWLAADAPVQEPEHLLGQVLARTARTRRRPAWRIPERWIPMSTFTTQALRTSRLPWRTIGVLALLILALAVASLIVVGSRSLRLAPAFGPARNGQIAFSDHDDIVAIDALTGNRTVLIGGPTRDGLPWFSPDGGQFAFVRGDPAGNAELWAADAGGTNAHRLAEVAKIGWVEWSPQSDVIAVTNDVDQSIITMVRADGSGSTVLHTGLAIVENPIWRPVDGRQLTFRGKDTTGTWGIYVMDRDGSDLVHLALDPGFQTDEYYDLNSDYYLQSPAWSSDGSKLMFYTLEPDPTSPAGPGFRIHIADVDGSGIVGAERKLEFDRQADDESSAAWLPGGDGIVFATLEGTTHRLMLSEPTGTKPARDLGVVAGDWIGFQVSPDGRQIISTSKPTSTSPALIQVTDVASAITTTLAISDDYAWQRTAP
jgi:Tol biopolymer transport system component